MHKNDDCVRGDPSNRWALLIGISAAVIVFVLAARLGARAVGGSDTSGYVTQAYLWLAGDLGVSQPLASDLPWPHPRESLTPLGYKPGAGTTAVPIYPPGLPMIFAMVIALGGDCLVYLVPAFAAAVVVTSTYLFARRLRQSHITAAFAAVLTASSPTLLFIAMLPMSDAVTTGLWTLSLALLTSSSRPSLVAGTALAALGVLVRPNLVPLTTIAALTAGLAASDRSFSWPRAIVVLLGAAPAALAVATINDHLYGSPLISGYGPTGRLYALEYLATNVRQFGGWLVTTEGLALWPLLLSLPIGSTIPPGAWRRWLPPVLFAAGVVVAYLLYLPFDAWWFLRFLLPAFPMMFIASASILVRVTDALPTGRRLLVLILLGTLAIGRTLPYWEEIQAVGHTESRYAAVGRYVDTVLPENAAIVSMLHSSSVRFYSGRLIVRYDAFSPTRLPFVIDWLLERGYRPYLVIDNTEEADFVERFGQGSPVGRLDRHVQAEWSGAGGVKIYDASRPRGAGSPHQIWLPPGSCVEPKPGWQLSRRINRQR